MPSNSQRISVLKGMLKVLLLIFIITIVVVIVKSTPPESESINQTVSFEIKTRLFTERENYVQIELVKGRALMIIRLDDADKTCYAEANEWLVIWAQGTDLNCPLRLLSAQQTAESVAGEFCRALQDQCRGSIYKLSGDVYPEQIAKQPLRKPAYSIKELNNKIWLEVVLD